MMLTSSASADYDQSLFFFSFFFSRGWLWGPGGSGDVGQVSTLVSRWYGSQRIEAGFFHRSDDEAVRKKE